MLFLLISLYHVVSAGLGHCNVLFLLVSLYHVVSAGLNHCSRLLVLLFLFDFRPEAARYAAVLITVSVDFCFSFDPSPFTRYTFWSLVVGGFFTSMTIYGSNQAMIQRYLAMPSTRKAQM